MAEASETTPGAVTDIGTTFPKAKVEACLIAELIEAAKVEAEIKEIDVPATIAGQRAMEINIDSLIVVESLIKVEPILGFELKDDVVREGGYDSVEKAMKHLLPRIETEWTKRKGKKA